MSQIEIGEQQVRLSNDRLHPVRLFFRSKAGLGSERRQVNISIWLS
jgi:hypothetical protein